MRVKKHRRNRNKSQNSKVWFKKMWTFKGLLKLGIAFGLGIVAFCFVYGAFFLPSVTDASELSFAESTIIYDRGALEPGAKPEEHILYIIHGDENRDYIPLAEISEWVPKATLAIEDDAFYNHFGFDAPALVKVFLYEAFGIGTKRGGSTITQQLAKQVFLSGERSYMRKFKELLLSIKLEWVYTKDEILELYLNKIPYGNNAFGIEAAARTYFGKSSRDLTIAEASVLASIPVAPTRFSPYGSNRDLLMGFYKYENFSTEAEARAAEEAETTTTDDTPAVAEPTVEVEVETEVESDNEETTEPDPNAGKLKVYKKGRKDLVLQRLLDLEKITPAQFYQAWSEGVTLEFKRGVSDIRAPHFVFYIREQLESKYGEDFLNQGGLQIYTTLDPDLQAQAEETIAIKTEGYNNVYGAENVAMTAINPDNGEILAYIGGKDWFNRENDGQVDVLTSRRQPGSSFKPLVFAAAFMQGFSPATVAFDVETNFGGGYTPRNFDEKYAGPVSLRSALNRSLNIPAIKMAALAGADKVLALADTLGIPYEGDDNTHGVAIGVGVAEVEPLSHIASFQAFAGDGSYHDPVSILEIRNADGEVLEKIDHKDYKNEGLDSEIAALVRNVLTDEKARPVTGEGDEAFDWNTFLELKPEFNSGAKTGTSNRVIKNPNFNSEAAESDNNRRFLTVPGDSWTVGFTPHLVAGVWVGNNRGKPMRSGATGMTVAAPVWKNFMDNAHEILVENGADREKKYNEPDPLTEVAVNRLTAKRVTENTPEHLRITEVFPSYGIPSDLDTEIGEQTINIFTGEVADDETPDFAKRTVNQLPLKSLQPQKPSWQEPVQKWLNSHPIFTNSMGAQFDPEPKEVDENGEELANDDGWKVPVEFIADLPVSLQKRWRQLENKAKLTGEPLDWTEMKTSSIDRFDRNSQGLTGDKGFNITSPTNSVAPGEVAVEVSFPRTLDIDYVEYYWDEELIYKAMRSPFTGKFDIPAGTSLNSSHEITAIAATTNFEEAIDSVRVRVRPDTSGPSIIFLGPLANQQISINSQAQVVADVTDSQSKVKSVEFLLNNNSLGINTKAPFIRDFTAPTTMGRHTLTIKAEDTNGNKSSKSMPFTVTREGLNQGAEPNITSAEKNFRTLSIQITLPEPETIAEAQIVVSQPESVLYEETWKTPEKFKYFFIPSSNFKGSAGIGLYIKKVGETQFKKADSANIRF